MHYTLRSGIRTEQVSSSCPVCHVRVVYPGQSAHSPELTEEFITDRTVCCSQECYRVYFSHLMDLWEAAQRWGRRYLSIMDQCVSPVRLVTRYLTEGDY